MSDIEGLLEVKDEGLPPSSGGGGKTGSLFGTEALSKYVFNPGDEASIMRRLGDTTGYNLITGTMKRRTQAISDPKEYIRDKTQLWTALIKGNTKGLNLAVPLPGRTSGRIPDMSPLVKEWQHTFDALTSSGVPTDTAKEQADNYSRIIFNQRLQMFSTAFPGLVDDAYESALKASTLNSAFGGLASGLNDVPQSDKYKKYSKYKKRAKKYKKNKKKKKPATQEQ